MQNLSELLDEAKILLSKATSIAELEQLKARYLGKNGALTEQLKTLKNLDPDARRTVGAEINQGKDALENLVQQCRDAGLSVEYSFTPAKSDKQFKRAQELNARFTVRLQTKETGPVCVVKNLRAQEQFESGPDIVAATIKEKKAILS